MSRLDRHRLQWWRWARWSRRVLAGALLLAAVLIAGTGTRPPAAVATPSAEILVATHTLGAGHRLAVTDVTTSSWPLALVPAAALGPAADVVGRIVTGAVAAGEPITALRLLGDGFVQALSPGTTAVPIRLADAGVGALLRPGDHIDLYAVPAGAAGEPAPVQLLAARAVVIAVPEQPDGVLPEGSIVVVAVRDTSTAGLVRAAYTGSIAATLAPP